MREDWERCTISEISEVLNGDRGKNYPSRAHYVNSGIPFVSAGNIGDNKKLRNELNFITEEKFELLRAGKLQRNDIVYCIRGSIGKFAIIDFDQGAIASSLCIIRTNEIVDRNYFCYYLESPLCSLEINKFDNGTAQPNLSAKDFKRFELPLSSISEQRVIVAKIEELFSDLDKGVADLKKAQGQLKVYRQAVLKKAFEGLEKETTLEEIKEDSLIGLVRASGLQNSNGEGTAYLKMDKIDMIGNVELEDLVYVETNEDEIEKYALKTGDILLNTRNSYELVGKTGIVRNINKTVVFNNNIMRIRVNESYDPYFICYQLISPFVRKQMDKLKKATTSVCALYQRNLFPLKLKVIDIKEQHQIIQEIESRLSVCDKVEESIIKSIEKAEALRQSILKKAFEGNLLSTQEIKKCKAAPDYEPAAVLLEKIKMKLK